jgi:hypothetical protein
MTTAARMQPEPEQGTKKIDIPNWIIAVLAILGIVFAAGSVNARLQALEQDHVGKTEVQDIKESQRNMSSKIDEIYKIVVKR